MFLCLSGRGKAWWILLQRDDRLYDVKEQREGSVIMRAKLGDDRPAREAEGAAGKIEYIRCRDDRLEGSLSSNLTSSD